MRKQFKDIDEVLGWFQDGAETPYYYKDGLYGLPDTQSFYLMFYRTDILEERSCRAFSLASLCESPLPSPHK